MTDRLIIQFWDFEDAPADLRRGIPLPYAGGWVALIPSGRSSEVAETLLAFLNSSGLSFICCETEEDGAVLAGPHRSGHDACP